MYVCMYECTCKFIICRQMKYRITKSLTFTTTNYIYTFSIYMYKIQVSTCTCIKNEKPKTFIFHPLYNCYHLPLLENDSHQDTSQRYRGYYMHNFFSIKFAYEKYILHRNKQSFQNKIHLLHKHTGGPTILYCK